MNFKQKLALLKKLGVKCDDDITEEEADKLISENAEVIETDEEEKIEGDDTVVEEITEKQLNEKISKGVKSAITSLRNELMAGVKSVTKSANDLKKDVAEKGANFIKGVAGLDANFKAVDSGTSSFGYTVPTEVADTILEKRDALSKMRKYAFVFNMAGTFQLATEGTAVTSYWVDENDDIDESNPTTSKVTLNDYYLATRVIIPRKLLNTSAVNIMNYISNLSSRSIVVAKETAFVAGDGDSKPTGLRTATITGIPQADTAFEYDDLVNLYYGLPEQYRDNAVFMTSSAGMKLLRKLKDTTNMPIFDPAQSTIFGRPVIESSNIPSNLGSGGNETEILFGDLSYYWIKDGEAMFMETDKVISKLQVELVVAEATDGILTLTDAFRKLTGVK